MNKFIGLALLCAGLAGYAHAQTADLTQEDDTTYWYNNKAAFEQLDHKYIPSGILMDYGMAFTTLDSFHGRDLSSKAVDLVTLEQINSSLLSAQIADMRHAPLAPAVLYEGLTKGIAHNHLRVGGLLYAYQQIDPARQEALAVKDGALYNTYDEEGNLRGPYETKHVFAMALSSGFSRSRAVTVEMPAELWRSNMYAAPAQFSIDAGDGRGWRNVSPGSSFHVQYATDGAKHWKFKLQLSDGTIWLGNGGPLVVQSATADSAFTVTGSTPYEGAITSAHISIDYAQGHTTLVKPLIIVEGFDPGDVLLPNLEYGLTDIQNVFENELNSNAISPNNKLLTELNINQYDRVYVDWDNGSDYLERNAHLLKDIIRWVNDTKNNSVQSVLWGFSMGGVIGRYALKDLEDDGYNHQVRLFISHDAPHQGANVPYGAQVMAAHLLNLNLDYGAVLDQAPAGSLPVSGSAFITQALSLGMRPAARQMVIEQFRFNPQSSFFTPYNIDGPELHYNWQTKLKDKGYPSQCRNIAVSNGSECGMPQALSQPLFSTDAELYVDHFGQAALALTPAVNFTVNGLLMGVLGVSGSNINLPQINLPGIFNQSGNWSFVPGGNRYTADFYIKSNYDNIYANVYSGKLQYTKTIWLLPDITAFNSQWSASVSAKSWDAFPGGMYSNGLGSGHFSENAAIYNPFTGSISSIVAASANYNVAPRFGFVPTVSALDLGSNNNNIPSPFYYRVFTGTQPPAAPNNTPFDNFITAHPSNNSGIGNEEHIAITNRNAEFVGQEMGYNTTSSTNSCANACPGKAISGQAMICPGSYIVYEIPFTPYGSDYVSWSISPQPSAALVQNGNECKVTNTGAADAGHYTLTATVHTVCGNIQFAKEIYMGNPNLWLAAIQVNGGEVVSVQPDCMPGISKVQWSAPFISAYAQTTPIGGYGYPCWFFNHVFTPTSDNYPVRVSASIVTPCGVKIRSIDYTNGSGSSGPTPNNPYSAGNSSNGNAQENADVGHSSGGLRDNYMTVSPNPSKGNWNLNSYGKDGTYSLSDISGKNIITGISFKGNTSVSSANLAKGIYFLKVQTNEGSKVFKLVKE